MSTDPLRDIELATLFRMTTEEFLAVSDGQDLATYRAEQLERQEIAKEAERFLLLPPSDWPSLQFNWDYRDESQRFTLDGCKPDSFPKVFPQGLRLGLVVLQEFDAKLSLQNKRELEEVWTLGDLRIPDQTGH